jgi:hypothetical protein
MRGLCGDLAWRAAPGSFVWLPRDVPHGYAVDGDAPLRTLAITLPAGSERLVVEVGEPTQDRTLPPPAAPDVPKLLAATSKYGQGILGPPESWGEGRLTRGLWPDHLVTRIPPMVVGQLAHKPRSAHSRSDQGTGRTARVRPPPIEAQ